MYKNSKINCYKSAKLVVGLLDQCPTHKQSDVYLFTTQITHKSLCFLLDHSQCAQLWQTVHLFHGSRSRELVTKSLQNKHLGDASSSFNFCLEGLGSFALLKSSCGPHLCLVHLHAALLFFTGTLFVAPQAWAFSVLLVCLSFALFLANIRYGLLVKIDAPSLVLLILDADCDDWGYGDKSTALELVYLHKMCLLEAL